MKCTPKVFNCTLGVYFIYKTTLFRWCKKQGIRV